MSKFDKKMEEFFDIEPELDNNIVTIENNPPTIFNNLDDDFQKDYEKSRQTLDELVETGKDLLQSIAEIAKESEKERAFETAALLLSSITNANKEIMDLHKKVRDITNYKSTEINNSVNIDKAVVYSGSTSELLKLVKSMNNETVND